MQALNDSSSRPTRHDKQFISRIRRGKVFWLCLFFGIFGIHRFYLQKFRSASFQFLTLGGLGLWTLTDLVTILRGKFRDQHGYRIERWS